MLNSTEIATYKRIAQKHESNYGRANELESTHDLTAAQVKFVAKYRETESRLDETLETATDEQIQDLVEWAASRNLMALVMELEERI